MILILFQHDESFEMHSFKCMFFSYIISIQNSKQKTLFKNGFKNRHSLFLCIERTLHVYHNHRLSIIMNFLYLKSIAGFFINIYQRKRKRKIGNFKDEKKRIQDIILCSICLILILYNFYFFIFLINKN